MAFRNGNKRGGRGGRGNGGGRQERKDMTGKLYISEFYGKKNDQGTNSQLFYGAVKVNGEEYKVKGYLNVGFDYKDDRQAVKDVAEVGLDVQAALLELADLGVNIGLVISEDDGEGGGRSSRGSRSRGRRDDDEDDDRRPSSRRRSRRDDDEDEADTDDDQDDDDDDESNKLNDDDKPWSEEDDAPPKTTRTKGKAPVKKAPAKTTRTRKAPAKK